LGQDLKGLSDYLKQEGNPELILSYFSPGDPLAWNIKYQPLAMTGAPYRPWLINSMSPAKEYLAVSVFNLIGVLYDDHNLFNWLRDYPVKKKIGYTIYVYDITSDISLRKYIRDIYLKSGEQTYADREAKIIEILKPHDLQP